MGINLSCSCSQIDQVMQNYEGSGINGVRNWVVNNNETGCAEELAQLHYNSNTLLVKEISELYNACKTAEGIMENSEMTRELEQFVALLEGSTQVFIAWIESGAVVREQEEMKGHLQEAWEHVIRAKQNLLKGEWYDDVAFHYDYMMARVEFDLYMHLFHRIAKHQVSRRVA